MDSKRTDRGRRYGITLIDLVVTVLIIGITAAVAVPRFSSTVNSFSLDAAAQRTAGVIDYSSRQARVTSQPVSISFDVGNNSFTVSGTVNPNHAGQTWTINLSEISDEVDLVSADFGGQSSVIMEIDGRPAVSGTIVLAVGPMQKTITVSSGTGRATAS